MKLYYVYLLKCKDDSYYVGFSSNLEKRVVEHNAGKYRDAYTYKRRPVNLVWFQDFTDPSQAIVFEKKIKKWSRAKKEALINDDFNLLPLLSQCKNESHSKNKGLDSAQPDSEV
ncbi:putative endonuclease [Flavobacterium sp. 28A]|uniref:GIY-YIG nuclease family protein n=1 Tax=Flavobacterium sp. 28A TaxID=2735895 RepID=UPI00156EEB6E|nr:GIY-YIG nuclease family protein [Flavobacterium sp. 28A]NRT15143.1 putative endonuclease [Flavobacterium sp. 28A]